MKKIYLIHHSHTDIGYTHPQEIICQYHVDFINQAIKICEDQKYTTFKWTCENFWQIENYIKNEDQSQVRKLISIMKNGQIDFSLNYLNMTELIDMNVYEEKLLAAKNFADKYDLNFKTAMSADINGYSKLYVEKLAKLGIVNNISCVHTHHGAHAFGKKPYIFDWETKYGNVRTVLAPHYHIGNELFIMPNAGTTYLLDETQFGIDGDNTNFQITRQRIDKLLNDIVECEDYHFDFIPIMISGVISDNGMPNADICNFIAEWNNRYQDVELELVTLDGLFKVINKLQVPVHSGDMNDWWADGVGSTPKGTKLFKSAQRKYNQMKKLDPNYANNYVLDNLILYSEHTWGHSASVSNPYNTLVDEMMLKKQNYAINAHSGVNTDLERFLLRQDKVTILPNRDKTFRIVNSLDYPIQTTGVIVIEHWELIDGHAPGKIINNLYVIDEQQNIYPSQCRPSDRGHEIEFEIKLEAEETKLVKVVYIEPSSSLVKNEVCDRVNDFKNKRFERFITNQYETEHFKLNIDLEANKISIFDKDFNQYISDSVDFLKIITTKTEASNGCESRRKMGRNRISGMSSREVASSLQFEFLEIGPVYTVVRVHQHHAEMVEAYVDIKMYNQLKIIKFDVNYLKQATKNIENIYFNFNLNHLEAESLILTKSADQFDPLSDLLPHANNQFFIHGEMIKTKNYQLLTPDSALLTFDNGQYQAIDLERKVKKTNVCFWLANNFWETNFYTDLSGYFNFRFVLEPNTNGDFGTYTFENPIVYPSSAKFKE